MIKIMRKKTYDDLVEATTYFESQYYAQCRRTVGLRTDKKVLERKVERRNKIIQKQKRQLDRCK